MYIRASNCLEDNCTLNLWAAPSFTAWWIQRTWEDITSRMGAELLPPLQLLRDHVLHGHALRALHAHVLHALNVLPGSHAPTSSHKWSMTSMTLYSHGNHLEPSFLLRHRSEDSLQSNLAVAGLQNCGLQLWQVKWGKSQSALQTSHASCNCAAWVCGQDIMYPIVLLIHIIGHCNIGVGL